MPLGVGLVLSFETQIPLYPVPTEMDTWIVVDTENGTGATLQNGREIGPYLDQPDKCEDTARYFAGLTKPLKLNDDDAKKIICFDSKNLEKDFDIVIPHGHVKLEGACLEHVQLQIVYSTLKVVSGIMIKQFIYIFATRFVMCEVLSSDGMVSVISVYQTLVGSSWITLKERTFYSYLQTLMASYYGKISGFWDMIWNLL